MVFEVSGMPVKVTKKNIKNMHLYVKPPDGHIEVSAPLEVSDEAVLLFVRTKSAWIRAKRAVFESQPRQTERQYVSGESFYVLGKQYYLRVKHSNHGNSIELNGDDAVLTVRESSTGKQREAWVREWYRDILKHQIERLLPKWIGITGLEPSSWKTKNMTTRWGSCNTKARRILFNLQLAKKPIECIDYVILHELIHLKVCNHGQQFVALMDEYMPYWREVRKRLNDMVLDYMEIGDRSKTE